jgi:transaldolase/glucose-6-phosphate isomerase
MKRLWQRDRSLWTGRGEAQWLGWLDVVDEQMAQADNQRKIADEVRGAG